MIHRLIHHNFPSRTIEYDSIFDSRAESQLGRVTLNPQLGGGLKGERWFSVSTPK